MTLSIENGEHLTHGHPKNSSGMLYHAIHYDIFADTGYINYDQMTEMVKKESPKLITIGASIFEKNRLIIMCKAELAKFIESAVFTLTHS